MLLASLSWLLSFAGEPPAPKAPDVVVELPSGWVTFVDGTACDAVYVVVPVHGAEDIAGATFWSIPFHPDGVIPEDELASVCDYGAILDGAVATKQMIEDRFDRSLAARPVSGFLYKAAEGYALGTMLVDASKQLKAKSDPTAFESHAALAFTAIGKHQHVLLGNAVKAKPDADEAAFVRNIDFSYALRRFEIEDQGPLGERDNALATAAPSANAVEVDVKVALLGDERVVGCVAKIGKHTNVTEASLRVRVTGDGKVKKIRATGDDDGADCFDRATKAGLVVEPWDRAAATVRITVPAA